MSLITRNLTPDRLDESALVDARASLSWREVDHLLDRATLGLIDALAADQRVGVFSTNCAEGVLAYVAAMGAGRSSVPINSHLSAAELAYILSDAGIEILFTGPECVDVALAAVAQVGRGRVIAWRCPGREGVTAWEDWLAAQREGEPPADLPPRPHLNYTSGTTGKPKAVETPPNMFPRVATAAELFDELGRQMREAGIGPSLSCAPLYHAGPLRLMRVFAGGGKLVILDRFDPLEVLAAIERHRITRTVMVPTHFQRLLELEPAVRDAHDVSSLRLVYHTGAACPVGVKRAMIAWFGPVLFESYGATEAGAVCTIDSHAWLERPGSVGRAAAPFQVLILDDAGKELPANTEGRMFFRDTTGRGLVYRDADKTQAAHIAPGVFTLGEVGYVDEEGYAFITDRASDMIVSGGVNIYPAEIEAVLLRREEIADVAVIGVPNADMGEEVKALVVLKAGVDAPDRAELDRFCRADLAGFKVPRSWEFVASVGRNAMGKVNKRELRRPWWPGERTIG